MFPLFPLPPTDHELQLRRLREEYGAGSAEMLAHIRRERSVRSARASRLRQVVATSLIRMGERLTVERPIGTALDVETPAEQGMASR
jgi:hypothetical protein